MKKIIKTSWLLLALPLLLVATGCSEDETTTGVTPGMAMLRAVHASPDAPAVDVWAEGGAAPLITNLAYGDASAYAEVTPGTYNIQLRAAGSTASDPVAYETGDIAIDEDAVITAVAAGLLASSDPADMFRILPLAESFVDPGAGNAAVRIVHAGADAPTVALDVGDDAVVDVADFARFADTGAAGVALPAGQALRIAVWAGEPLARVTAFVTPELPEGADLFVIATGLLSSPVLDDDSFKLLAVGPTGAIGFIDQDLFGVGAQLRVVHASPDAPAVVVYVEGVPIPVAEDLSYGEVTGYADLYPGDYVVELRAAGADPESAPAFSTGTLTISDDAVITAVAAGLFGSMDADDMFRVLPLVEDFDDPGAGNAAVRIVHAGADAPTVALDVGDDAVVDVADFARFADTGAAGVALPAGSALQVAIWAGETLSRVTGFTTPALPDGGELFVIATGLLSELPRDEQGFGLLAVGPDGLIGFVRQNPVVFALHGSPDAPAVDVYAGGAMLIENLDFGMISDPVQVPPGAYTLDFKANGTAVTAASATTPALAAGERYLAVASGFLGQGTFTLLPFGEAFAGGDSDALVRAIHASPDAPTVDIGIVDGGSFTAVPDFTGLAFGEASSAAGTVVPAVSATLGVAGTGTTTTVAEFDLAFTAGLRAFAVAAGALTPEAGEDGFGLVVVDATSFPWSAVVVTPN